jgi:hypothetical protein
LPCDYATHALVEADKAMAAAQAGRRLLRQNWKRHCFADAIQYPAENKKATRGKPGLACRAGAA